MATSSPLKRETSLPEQKLSQQVIIIVSGIVRASPLGLATVLRIGFKVQTRELLTLLYRAIQGFAHFLK